MKPLSVMDDEYSPEEWQNKMLGIERRVNAWLQDLPSDKKGFVPIPTWFHDDEIEAGEPKKKAPEVKQILKRKLKFVRNETPLMSPKLAPQPVHNVKTNINKLEEAALTWDATKDCSEGAPGKSEVAVYDRQGHNHQHSSKEAEIDICTPGNNEFVPMSFFELAKIVQGRDKLRALIPEATQDTNFPMISSLVNRVSEDRLPQPHQETASRGPIKVAQGHNSQYSIPQNSTFCATHQQLAKCRESKARKEKACIPRPTDGQVDLPNQGTKKYYPKSTGALRVVTQAGVNDDKIFPSNTPDSQRSFLEIIPRDSPFLELHSYPTEDVETSPINNLSTQHLSKHHNNSKNNTRIPSFNPDEDFHTNNKEHWHLLGLSRKPALPVFTARINEATPPLNPHPTKTTANHTPHTVEDPNSPIPIPVFPFPNVTTRCRARGCPLKFPHKKGPYLHEGRLRTGHHGSMFGASNPPPDIWAAYGRIKDEDGDKVGGKAKWMVAAEDVRKVQKFVRFHYGEILEGEGEEVVVEEEELDDGSNAGGKLCGLFGR